MENEKKEKIKKMDLKNMTVSDILELQDELQREINLRTNNLVDTLLTIEKIETKSSEILNFYERKIENLKNKNQKIKQLEEIGFSVFLYTDGTVGIINYKIDDTPNQYYGCKINLDLKDVVVRENMYIENKDLEKIKEILELI